MSRPSSSASTTSSTLSALLAESAPTLASLQAARLAELQAQSQRESGSASQQSVPANAPGLGAPVTLAEGPAISATAEAASALLLFTHGSMAACAAMDAALTEISARRRETLCVAVRAEHCTWLAEKLAVRVLPALVGFVGGKEVGRLVGFEGVRGGQRGGGKAVERVVRTWGLWGRDDGTGSEESEHEDERKERQGARATGRSIRDAKRRADDGDDDSDWD